MIEPHRIAGQFYNRPLLLTPQAALTISGFLMSRFEMRQGSGGDDDAGKSVQAFKGSVAADGKSAEFHSPRASRFYGEYRTGPDDRPTPYRVTPDGTAIVPVIGELVNRGAWVGASSGLVSYEGIKYSVMKAGQDPSVSAIILDIESPGGEAVGAFETAAIVRSVAREKPVVAFVNGMAASAGYSIASGASRIVTIPTGLSGSIGVVMMHLDMSQYLEDAGVKPTMIFAGAHKVDGNPHEPLPDGVRASFQSEVDQFYGMFVSSVAQGRGGRLTEQQARQTEARVFMGDDARRVGLTDEVGSFDEVMATLASPQSRSVFLGRASATLSGGPLEMSDETKTARTAEATEEKVTNDKITEAGSVAAAPATLADALASVTGQKSAAAAAGEVPGTPSAPGAPAAAPAAPGADAVAAERDRAAGIMELATQAARLGVDFDAAKAIQEGSSVDALRKSVLDVAAERDEASSVIATTIGPLNTAGAPTGSNGGLVQAAEKRRDQLLQQNGR